MSKPQKDPLTPHISPDGTAFNGSYSILLVPFITAMLFIFAAVVLPALGALAEWVLSLIA